MTRSCSGADFRGSRIDRSTNVEHLISGKGDV